MYKPKFKNNMKKLLFKSLLFILILGVNSAKAQISRSEWSFKPKITTTNNVYGNLFGGLLYLDTFWWPEASSKFRIIQEIQTSEGSIPLKWWDWRLDNFSVGYQVGYSSKDIPLGIRFQIDYEKVSLTTADTDQTFSKGMIVPTIGISVRFLDYYTAKYNPTIELNTSYDYAVTCKGVYSDIKSINNGFSSSIGMGVINTQNHARIILSYEHVFYNYFNQSYEINGAQPYKNTITKFGYLHLTTSFGF